MATNTNALRTIFTYALNSSTVNFPIAFDYLARKFVVVTLIGADRKTLVLNTDYRFTSKTQITTNKAWGAGDGYTSIEIRRYTDATDRLVDFQDGSILRASDLNISQVQTMHIAEEGRDVASNTLGVDTDGNLDARGRKMVNLVDGVNDGDAVTIRQMNTYNDSALNSKNAAAVSAAAALASQNAAKVSETNAKASETAAAGSASVATNQAGISTAQAVIATNQANAAAGSAGSASTSANAAAGSASTATAQADRAKTEADRAQTANPDNQLKKAQNLADVADVTASRGNLSVYSKAESDGEAWKPLSAIVNSPTFVVADAGGAAGRYRKKGNFVSIQGFLTGNMADNNTVFTLPVGYRPTTQIHIPVYAPSKGANTQTPRLYIETTGVARISNASTTGGNELAVCFVIDIS